MSQCVICGQRFSTPKPGTGRSNNLCRECEAKRSGVPQGCLPSATGSAGARASDEAGADSSGRSAGKAVRAMVRHFVVITNWNGLEETECAELREALATIEYALMKGATKFGLFVRDGESPALTAQRERACLPNDELKNGGQ